MYRLFKTIFCDMHFDEGVISLTVIFTGPTMAGLMAHSWWVAWTCFITEMYFAVLGEVYTKEKRDGSAS